MKEQNKPKKIALCLAGLAAGLVNGVFGAGGGMLAVVALERMGGLEKDQAHASALIVMLPLTLVSIAVYFFRGILSWEVAPWVAIGMLPGSFFGAKLLGRLKAVWIKRIFCLLMLIAGFRLLL